jgi:beta-lactamase class D
VGNKKNAELFFKINIHESNPNSTTKILSSYLSYSIEVKNKAKRTVYTYSSEKYKGVDYNIESAKEKSYVKAAEDINGSSFKKLMQAIIK